ncbi:uncharacterized protein LOC134706388 [Mytilus trossulus]|uniref:uncharacterized protein LOC134706388 n=1 Tax=Mytilus trossulus TaxID=6551 RepID=UPI0030067C69
MRRKDRFKPSETDSVNDSLNCTSEVESCPDRVAEELEDLLQRETISHQEYQRLRKTNRLPDNFGVCTLTENIDESAILYDGNLCSSSNAKHSQPFNPFPYNENGIPVNWTSNCKHSIYDIVTLSPGQKEYDHICDEMKSVGIQITKIERLENIHLLDRFKSETEHIKKHRQLGFNMNIQYLYHGTKVDKSRIGEEGLDQRLSRMGFFGKGIYFSDNPLKCIHYAKDSNLEESYILKCRVILGDSKHFPKGEYDTALQREPEKPDVKTGWRFYDSVVGCPRDYNEFVIYENRRAMIEYIISFKLDSRGNQELKTLSPSPFNDNSAFVTDDTHSDKIEEIRETIRRKRCTEKGEEYIPPDEDKKRKDRDLYLRLQQLHKGSQDSKSDAKESMEVIEERTGSIQSHKERTDSIQSNKDDIDPIEEVIDSLVTDFLVVTNTDNIEAAKYYIERSQMDVDKAITMYYEEML